jgi:hypothetical protein
MSSDSELFPPRWKWEEKGYRPDEYGHWLQGNWQPYSGPKQILQRPSGLILSADGAAAVQLEEIEDVSLPLYQGGMINQFDCCASAYRRVEGKRGFKWVPMTWDSKQLEPQYLMSREAYQEAEGSVRGVKLVLRNIARTTDTRTFIGTVINDLPSGHSLAVMSSTDSLLLCAVLDSFVSDWALRERLAGTNLSLFVIQDLVSPRMKGLMRLRDLAARLMLCHVRFATAWQPDHRRSWYGSWALTPHERLRCRVIFETAAAYLYGLTPTDFRQILSGSDHPIDSLRSKDFTRNLDPKGFWRHQKDEYPEQRLSVLAQVALDDLYNVGFDNFLAQNDSEGWMLPESLCLADHGLGHDDRAKEYQPVASVLGPRFYLWQLEQSVQESWEECERHAEILAKLVPPPDSERKTDIESGDGVAVDLFGISLETDLFGSPVYPKLRKR